ncbi:hypothetical protein AAZX31_13G023400 [Glycine max]
MILKEAFNMEVSIRLPQTKPPISRFSDGGRSSQSQKCHLHAVWDININFVNAPLQRSLPPITFTDRDFKGINPVNQDKLVVDSIIIANFMVTRVLIDQGSSVDILYWKTFQRLEVSPDLVHPHGGPLLSFTGEKVETRGYEDSITTFSQGKLSRRFTIRYLLVDTNTSYLALIGRKTLNELGAIVSTPHLTIKFLALTREIVTVKVGQKQTQQCYVENLKVAPYPPFGSLPCLNPQRLKALKS